jgi:hypothetical protein
MNKRGLVQAFAIASAALPGLWLSTSVTLAQDEPGLALTPGDGTLVDKATCGPGDHTESGLQGETTVRERTSGDSMTAYNCNLELVGQWRGEGFEGAFSQDGPAYFGDCAYVSTDRVTELQRRPGTQVIDASDPERPQRTAVLDDTPAALAPHETPVVSEERALLVFAQDDGENVAVYDVSDCADPVLVGQTDLEGSLGHMSAFSPDGRTYWVTQNNPNRAAGLTYVVDLTDSSNPVMLPTVEIPEVGVFHSVLLNPPDFPEPGTEGGIWMYGGQSDPPELMAIVDVSDYQFRRRNPEAPVVSTLLMDPGTPEPPVPMMINGDPFIFALDEAGGASGWGSWAAACEAGASSFGYPLLVDVSDHNNPKVAAKLWLEVYDPANCERLRQTTPPDIPGTAPGTNLPDASGTTNYSIERCVPNDPLDAKIMACSGQNAGLRVWDIRDPFHPREVAYWKPGAPRTAFLPASGSWAEGVDRTVDKIAGWARWVVEQNDNGEPEVHLWTVSDGNGFQVLRFTDNFKTVYGDLFDEAFGNQVLSESR